MATKTRKKKQPKSTTGLLPPEKGGPYLELDIFEQLGRAIPEAKRPGKWTAEVKPLYAKGMSVPEIALRFSKSRQAVWNVIKGKTSVYQQ